MKFVQIIEFTTSRVDELNQLMDEWLASTDGRRTAARGVQAQDRDRPGTYFSIVEFPSYEKAMENSALPATTAFAESMAKLCDGPPVFRNLDVIREESM
jgi:quinol monooxygenase YgiN